MSKVKLLLDVVEDLRSLADSVQAVADAMLQHVFQIHDRKLDIPELGFDGLVGYSPIAMAKNAIGMAIACEEYGAKFFANGAAPGGVLEHPGTIKDPQRVRESWQSTSAAAATPIRSPYWKKA